MNDKAKKLRMVETSPGTFTSTSPIEPNRWYRVSSPKRKRAIVSWLTPIRYRYRREQCRRLVVYGRKWDLTQPENAREWAQWKRRLWRARHTPSPYLGGVLIGLPVGIVFIILIRAWLGLS